MGEESGLQYCVNLPAGIGDMSRGTMAWGTYLYTAFRTQAEPGCGTQDRQKA